MTYYNFIFSMQDNFFNKNLINQKEGFGGRTICYNTYNLEKNNNFKIYN